VFGKPFKLSSFQSRTVNPGEAEQSLHLDYGWADGAARLVGFIWMVDDFQSDNGATRFVTGSQGIAECPTGAQDLATGPAGSLVVYDGATWHGFSANRSAAPRRSLQGAFILRPLTQLLDQRSRLLPSTRARLDATALDLLDVD
jgi:ectoine hydroxylase-related dioxygenase (phytanoyl-CoA dioxygenase family)